MAERGEAIQRAWRTLKTLMTTLPEVDGNGDEAKRKWREEMQKPTAKDKLEWMKKFHLIVGQSSHYRE